MAQEPIQIVIRGITASGKTTIALVIKEALQRYGMTNIHLIDDDKIETIAMKAQKLDELCVQCRSKPIIIKSENIMSRSKQCQSSM